MLLLHYFKIGLKNIQNNRLVSFSVVLGFSLAISITLPIVVSHDNQSKFDRNHHIDFKKIFRVETKTSDGVWATSPKEINERLRILSVVDNLTSVMSADLRVGVPDLMPFQVRAAFIDSTFNYIFNIPGVSDARQLQPFSILISRAVARKIFGSEEVIGEMLNVENLGLVAVAGVFTEPKLTHLDFEVYLPASLISDDKDGVAIFANCYNYVITEDGDSRIIMSAFKHLADELYKDAAVQMPQYVLQPVTRIVSARAYNDTNVVRTQPNLFIYALIGSLLFVLATFNYINLSLTRFITRAKEIGLKRVFGAYRRQIVFQLLLESILIATFALAIGVLIMVAIPIKDIHSVIVEANLSVPLVIEALIFSWIVGLTGGLLPCFILANSKITTAVKGRIEDSRRRKVSLQQILLTLQFTISIITGIVLIVFVKQTTFLTEADYGFKMENLVSVQLQGVRYDVLRNDIQSVSNSAKVSAVSDYFGGMGSIEVCRKKVDSLNIEVAEFFAGEHFTEVFDLTLLAGKDFEQEFDSNKEKYVIINETAARELNFRSPNEAIGEVITVGDSLNLIVLGVLKDFNFDNFKRPISAQIIRSNTSKFKYLLFTVNEKSPVAEMIHLVRQRYKQNSGYDNLVFEMYDERFKEGRSYKKDVRIVLVVAMYISVIALLSLTAITLHHVNKRAKEISIRKIYGAGESDIIRVLSIEFILIFLISVGIAIPIAWFASNELLSEFIHKVNLNASIFFIPTMLMLVVSYGLVYRITIWHARKNPTLNLRHE